MGEKQCIRKPEQSGDIHRLCDVTVAIVDDITLRGEYTRHRLRLLGITVNMAKSILTPMLNKTYNTNR